MPDDRRPDSPAQEIPAAPLSDLPEGDGVSRRSFLQWTAGAAGAASLGGLIGTSAAEARSDHGHGPDDGRHGRGPAPGLEGATVAELQAAMEDGSLSASQLVHLYLARIRALDRNGPGVNSIIQINPDAAAIARQLDAERRNGQVRGPLHGIPIVIKDNIDTGDRMLTTAGSLALVGDPAPDDAFAIARLREAGAIILGKAGLSEWANFRGFESSSGWSGRGGQVRNPYVLDRNPCGSSSGSGAAASASFAAAALGSETDGSIVCPASTNGVVGIKPTVGLVSRDGVVPISHTQDTIGVHGRTVADAAAFLGAMTGVDPADPKTAASAGNSFSDYTQFVDPDGLVGARIGVARQLTGFTGETDAIFEQAVQALADAGATIVDPVDIPSFDEFQNDSSEIIVLVYEFKRDLNAYLASRTGVPVADMADVIQFNLDHAAEELQYFGQEWFELAQAEIFSEAEYLDALERGPRLAGEEGIDAALAANGLDALIAPTGAPAWTTDLVNGDNFLGGSSGFAAVAGYPIVTVPAGDAFGLPVGVSFMASAWSEPTLIRLAAGFEAAAAARITPRYVPSLPLPRVAGHGASGKAVVSTAEAVGAAAARDLRAPADPASLRDRLLKLAEPAKRPARGNGLRNPFYL